MEKRVISFVFLLLSLAASCCYAQNSQQDYLNTHNSARANVRTSPLKWDARLVADAQAYLSSNVLWQCDQDVGVPPSGINLLIGDDTLTGSVAVNVWVAQKVNYNYATNSCSGGPCVAYTQVVWNTTAFVGCSRASCLSDDLSYVAIACKYNPAGNIPGVKPY